jgi:hypothetical protein
MKVGGNYIMSDDENNDAIKIAVMNFIERSDLRQTIVAVAFIVFMAIILIAMLGIMGNMSFPTT